MKRYRVLVFGPLVDSNPITLQILGICSALAVTTSVATALTMGACLTTSPPTTPPANPGTTRRSCGYRPFPHLLCGPGVPGVSVAGGPGVAVRGGPGVAGGDATVRGR